MSDLIVFITISILISICDLVIGKFFGLEAALFFDVGFILAWVFIGVLVLLDCFHIERK